jgi:diadenosine tetraphosphate (Ap4A) HIT family hydrolase
MCELCAGVGKWDRIVCSTDWCRVAVPSSILGRISVTVAPKRHVSFMTELSEKELLDVIKTTIDLEEIIRKKINPQGFLVFSMEEPEGHFNFTLVAHDGESWADLLKTAKPPTRQELLKIKNMFT